MNHYIIAPSASQDLNKIADHFLAINIEAGEKLFRKTGNRFSSQAQEG